MPESIQGVQAWDHYAYANNNPTRYTDSSGHCIGPLSAVCVTIGTFIIDHAAVITAIGAVGAATSFITADTPQQVLINDLDESQRIFENNLLVSELWSGGGATALEFGNFYSVPKLLPSSGGKSGELIEPSKVGSTNVATNNPIRGQSAPDFVVSPNGTVVIVPKGATGPVPTKNGQGFQYVGGSGGNGLSNDVFSVRIMDPTSSKPPSPGYSNGYVSYSNRYGQAINPYSGKPVPKSDPFWHMPLHIE